MIKFCFSIKISFSILNFYLLVRSPSIWNINIDLNWLTELDYYECKLFRTFIFQLQTNSLNAHHWLRSTCDHWKKMKVHSEYIPFRAIFNWNNPFIRFKTLYFSRVISIRWEFWNRCLPKVTLFSFKTTSKHVRMICFPCRSKGH